MKINICDICYKDNKLTQTEKERRIKGRSALSIAYCDKHEKDVPTDTVEFVRKCFELDGIKLTETDQEIKDKFLRR